MKLLSVAPYLLLVSFMTGPAGGFTADMADVLRGSPYNGVAVVYAGEFFHDTVDVEERKKEFSKVAHMTGKEVWPWVFLNRIVGKSPGRGVKPGKNLKNLYFKKIKGMDLFNETGDRAAFMEMWRGALATAKTSGAPGVVLDPEPYNDHGVYRMGYLSRATGRDVDTVKDALMALGADMADAAASEYPDAVIWALFTTLDKKRLDLDHVSKDYLSHGYIMAGMLDRSLEKGYRFKLVSGGEWGLRYCYKDLDDLKGKITDRDRSYAGVLAKYPNLALGGTLTIWPSAYMKRDWLLRGECAECALNEAYEFVPYVRELLDSYGYVWIYGAVKAGCMPYDRGMAERIDRTLRAALAATSAGEKGEPSRAPVPVPAPDVMQDAVPASK